MACCVLAAALFGAVFRRVRGRGSENAAPPTARWQANRESISPLSADS